MKKYLVLLLALTMLVSCCTGCGKTAGAEADSENTLFSCGLLPVRDYETFQYGYMNKKGRFVIPPRFEKAERFSPCGLAAVKLDGKWGYISTNGEFAFEPQYDYGRSFAANGLAAMQSGKKWGYMNQEGKFVIEPQFDFAGDFRGNVASVQLGEYYGLIDEKGNWLYEPVYESAFFSDLFGLFSLDKDGEDLCVNEAGEAVEEPSVIGDYEQEGNLTRFQQDGKWGLRGKNGEIVAEPIYDYIDGEAHCGRITFDGPGGIGFFDEKGKVVIPGQFGPLALFEIHIENPFFDDGYAVVSTKEGYGVIDVDGNYIIGPSRKIMIPDGY